MQPTEQRALPTFRGDLKVYAGPNDEDGSPTYNVFDPAKGQYYKFSWKESLVLKTMKPGMTAAQLAETLTQRYPVVITTEEVNQFFGQAAALGLLQMPQGGDHLYQNKLKTKQSLWSWFLMHYLFIRFPLINPDRFLGRTIKYVEILGSKFAIFLYVVIVCIGMTLLVNRYEQFFGTFDYFFNLEGLIFYACAISAVKIIHEFSHAYVAKHHGLYVPAMGVAFLVLWPVLFTDVTDAWKLPKRSKRFTVSFAGIAAELVIAGISLIGWVLTDPGMWNSIFFVLASTSLFSTLVVNINPAVRFDGYYILSDIWGIDNLFSRAFAVARWKFHKGVLGLDLPPPEENLSTKRTLGFIVFSIYVFSYRLFLYTAIALFVYYKFTKVLGIFLFLVEIAVFFVWPVWWEVQVLYQLRHKITKNPRSMTALAVITLAACWLVLPWPHKMGFQGVVMPNERQIVYAPEGAQVEEVFVQRGQWVHSGDPVVVLSSRNLLKRLADTLYDGEVLKQELLILGQEKENEQYLSGKKAQLASSEELSKGLMQKRAQLTIMSEIDGQVEEWPDDLRLGQYVSKGEPLGIIANPNDLSVITYVHENDIEKFHEGQEAEIISQRPLMFLKGQVDSIQKTRSGNLIYPTLASVYRGPLPVVQDPRHQGLRLVESYYTVRISMDPEQKDLLRYGQRMEVRIRGPWRSYLVTLVNALKRVLLRESSF